jgi:hypothetical protein
MGLVVYEIQGDFEHIFPFWSREQYRDEHLAEAKTGKDVERTCSLACVKAASYF